MSQCWSPVPRFCTSCRHLPEPLLIWSEHWTRSVQHWWARRWRSLQPHTPVSWVDLGGDLHSRLRWFLPEFFLSPSLHSMNPQDCVLTTPVPHAALRACAKFFLSHLEEKPDCSKARCEVQFSPRCPEDSVLIEGYAPPGECCPLPSRCVCDPAGCLRKVCQPGYLNILVSKASGKPGQCCDLYECKPGTRGHRLRSLAASRRRVAAPSATASLPGKMGTPATSGPGSLTSGLPVREPECSSTSTRGLHIGTIFVSSFSLPSKCAWQGKQA